MMNKIENLENDDFLTVADLPANVRDKLNDDLDPDDLIEIDRLAAVMDLQVEEGDGDAYCTAGDFRAMLAALRCDEVKRNPYGAMLVDDNITEADLPSPPVDDGGVSADIRAQEMFDLVARGDDAAARGVIESEENPAVLHAFVEQLEKSGADGALRMAAMARAAELEDAARAVVRDQSNVLTNSFNLMLREIDRGRARGQIDDGAALR
jgi:hypothetical protein